MIFSFEKAKQSNPQFEFYYKHVVSVDVSGEREVTFRFDEKNNRELPAIVGEFPIVPKHWWEANGADGKPRDIARTTLELPMGSGAYRIAAFSPGSTIRYERRDDYWGKDIAINVGQHNFAAINYVYFADRDVEFQAFRAHNTDFWVENEAKRWATGYDFPAVASGQVKRETPDNAYRTSGVMQAFVPNMRRDKFKSPQLRLALNYAFDFEELNRTNFFDQYKRIDSFFYGSEMASSGLPEGRELAILNEVKAVVPPEVFTTPYKNPVGGDQARQRANLQQALQLFKQAGYELKGNRLADVKTGEQLSIEILVDNPAIVRVVSPFAQTLKKIGVDATVRMVDASQYQNRLRSFDYDMIIRSLPSSLSPGAEQLNRWGSDSRDANGSFNYAGVADPDVDRMLEALLQARSTEDFQAAVRAYDRLLTAGHYIIPLYYIGAQWVARWKYIERPDGIPLLGAQKTTWWDARTQKTP